MKVCILSMQDVQNYGSLLQALSLKQMLEEIGHSVCFISIKPNEEENELVPATDNFVEDMEGKGYLARLRKIDRYLINRIRNKKRTQEQFKLLDQFRNEYLPSNDNDTYEYCVIGSDEVFNCMLNSKWGFTSQLFGNVKQARHVITYAASCGSTTIDTVPIQIKNIIYNSFLNISAFSARDDNTIKFIASLTNNSISKNVDPVIVADFDNYIDGTKLPDDFPKRYCIVYSYPNRFHDQDEITEIKKFAKEHCLTLISLGGYQMWIDKPYALSPFQLLKAFKNADFVITDTFHGTIFSAKYAKKFAVAVRKSNSNKLTDLINTLGIENHRVYKVSSESLNKVAQVENDFEHIWQIEQKERDRSLSYLKENIQ